MKAKRSILSAGPIQLLNGRRVWFRPIRPDDTERLREFHRRLSPSTQRMRFFTPMRELSAPMAKVFCNVDFERRVAVCVCYPGEDAIRGVGRYEVLDSRTAEVAFVLEDDLQGLGVGTALLRVLANHARVQRIETFTAMVLPENAAMLAMFSNSEFPSTAVNEEGTTYVTLDISDAHEPLPLVAAEITGVTIPWKEQD